MIKKMFFGMYILLIVFITACLLAYNQFKITEFGNINFIIVDRKTNYYQKGDLLIAKRISYDQIEVGDVVAYYNTYLPRVNVNIALVNSYEIVNDQESTFLLNDDTYLSSEYIITNDQNITRIPFVGYILGILESRIGYLLFVILPLGGLLTYQMYILKKEGRRKVE